MLLPGLLLAILFNTSNILFLRLLCILPSTNPTAPLSRKRGTPTRLLIILGSGGHTAEMLSLLRDLDPASYTHRSYVISAGDDFSARKAAEFEEGLRERARQRALLAADREANEERWDTYDIAVVPRARKIHQSLLTTPFSALRCLFACFAILRSPNVGPSPSSSPALHTPPQYPDLILSNGPGTGVMVILASLLLRFVGFPRTRPGQMRTIYVESWARVKGLSLSGKILVRMVDRFLVQWAGLNGVGGRGEFRGVLVH
ncbi:Oligosaccharide biosynthesis protein Alg14-like [Lasallia pustulata]|uniref:UDP-N-acetylglucosamine transferase subunit ALG14 n=1 Tax=Lasallia pustulata TaxID=136370 RepID=A0A1W5DB73_9LECA|nr:Oligosaccharide biosynthesis protein Alg14-like [Lasallia pustulata]